MSALNIRQIIEQVTRGQIRIPAFQRGFVWEADRIAHLMDSIYKRYPFGSVLLWRTREKLSFERDLGPFKLPAPEKDYPVDYVLDGQQRITSLFGVFQSSLPLVEGSSWPKIYFDFSSDAHPQDTQFFALRDDEVDLKTKHFPISVLFDPVAYRKATSIHGVDVQAKIDKLQDAFKEADVPVQMVETDEKARVAIIFERVNRQGVVLDTLQLLSAWTWSEDFQLQEQFKELAEELEPFGFADIGSDSNLLLRCCSAILSNDPSPEALMTMRGSDVRDKFELIKNGVRGAIDFAKSVFGAESLYNLPYAPMLVPLAAFFAANDGTQVAYNNDQRRQISRWFWRTALSRRYSSGFSRNLHADILEILKLRENKQSELGNFSTDIDPNFFILNDFGMGNVNTKTFILLLASAKPVSFVSGTSIDLAKKIKKANRNEFHHLMPKAFLRQTDQKFYSENCLANFCFLSRADNQTLGGEAPSEYKNKLPATHDHILATAVCPNSLWEDDYVKFIRQRADLLTNKARELCQL